MDKQKLFGVDRLYDGLESYLKTAMSEMELLTMVGAQISREAGKPVDPQTAEATNAAAIAMAAAMYAETLEPGRHGNLVKSAELSFKQATERVSPEKAFTDIPMNFKEKIKRHLPWPEHAR